MTAQAIGWGEDLYEADGRKYSSWYEYEYDNAGNQTKSIRYASDGRVYWWREYEYDNEGNLTKIIDYSWADTTVYEYITITPHNEVTANN